MSTLRRCWERSPPLVVEVELLDQRDLTHAAAALSGDCRGRLGRAQQASLRQVGGVGEAGRLTDDDPDAGAPVSAAGKLFDLAVVEKDRRARAVLGENLGEVTSSSERLVQHPLEDGRLDEV